MNDDFALRHFHPMRRRLVELARTLLGTSADAEDTVQDAWLRVHDGVPANLASIEAWLATVVRHLAVDRLRRRRLEQAWQHAAARDARVLHAVLARPLVMARSMVGTMPRAAIAPRAHCTLGQVDGRYAVVLALDGVVLCALPVGSTASDERETVH